MFKGKFAVLTLMVAALALSISMMPGADVAYSGIVDAENSDASAAGSACWLIDPVGQGDLLVSLGATITVTARDNLNAPIPDIPATDFWVIGAADQLCLCGGSASSNADSVSSSTPGFEGQTTISGTARAGGHDSGIQVVIQATVVTQVGGAPLVLPIVPVSPDVDCDLAVDSPDFSLFALAYTSPPKAYQSEMDYNCDGQVELIDFTLFAQHYLRVC